MIGETQIIESIKTLKRSIVAADPTLTDQVVSNLHEQICRLEENQLKVMGINQQTMGMQVKKIERLKDALKECVEIAGYTNSYDNIIRYVKGVLDNE